MRDEGDLHDPPQPAAPSWHRVLWVSIVALIVVYALLTAALVLTHA